MSTDTEVCLAWTERGGPSVEPPGGEGYGSKLLDRSVTGQLGGSISTDWPNEGVVITLTMNSEKLST